MPQARYRDENEPTYLNDNPPPPASEADYGGYGQIQDMPGSEDSLLAGIPSLFVGEPQILIMDEPEPVIQPSSQRPEQTEPLEKPSSEEKKASYSNNISGYEYFEEPVSFEFFSREQEEMGKDDIYLKKIEDDLNLTASMPDHDGFEELSYDEYGNVIATFHDPEEEGRPLDLEEFEAMHREAEAGIGTIGDSGKEFSWDQAPDDLKTEYLRALAAVIAEHVANQSCLDPASITEDMISYLPEAETRYISDLDTAPDYIHHILDMAETSQKGTRYPLEMARLYQNISEALNFLPADESSFSHEQENLVRIILSYPITVKQSDSFFSEREKLSKRENARNGYDVPPTEEKPATRPFANSHNSHPSSPPRTAQQAGRHQEDIPASRKNGTERKQAVPEQADRPTTPSQGRSGSPSRDFQQIVNDREAHYQTMASAPVFGEEAPDIIPSPASRNGGPSIFQQRMMKNAERKAADSFDRFILERNRASQALDGNDITGFKRAYEAMLYCGKNYASSKKDMLEADPSKSRETDDCLNMMTGDIASVKNRAQEKQNSEIDSFFSSPSIKALEESLRRLIEAVKKAIARLFGHLTNARTAEQKPNNSPTP